jgi:hypothetical protein
MSRQRPAEEAYEIERAPLSSSQGVMSWLRVLVAGAMGGVSSPRLYECRVYERSNRRLVLTISDDEVGTDYFALLHANLKAMSAGEFAAEWKIEEPTTG